MNNEEAKQLINKYNNGHCTSVEKELLESWYMDFNEHDIDLSPERIKEIGDQIYSELPGVDKKNPIIKIWSIIAVAASISLIGISIFVHNNRTKTIPIDSVVVNDIAPGGNKATFTLANGEIINLSDVKTGISLEANKLSYEDGTPIANNDQIDLTTDGYKTIATPKGGQYQIKLPDGTKVWLNAATTLTFGSSLSERGEGNRSVKLSGEAYFEVFEDKKRPFIVETVQQKIKVLGTHFNINAYQNLNNITTLTEGSVKIISGNNGQTLLLKPGQQSDYSGRKLQAKSVDIELYTAWKNGKLQFENTDLKTVMEMVSRWYNVDVTYENYPYESRFTGSISRSKNISEVLNILANTGEVNFKILGKEVIVMH